MNSLTMNANDQGSIKLMDTIKLYESHFIKVVCEKLGIVIHDNQINELFRTILHACKEFNLEPKEYLKELETGSSESRFFEYLIRGVTVGETYFFRDKRQIHLLENVLLPRIIKNKREKQNKSLRIWSAGCSTGEEIFTILMLLYEILPDYKEWTFNLLGTDINKTSLEKAVVGHYSQWAMRSIPEYYKDHYFIKEKHDYILDKEIVGKVKLQYLNLNNDLYPSLLSGINAQDLILCRNVLIYFDKQSIPNIMKKMNLSLVEGGFLMLGASDPILIHGTELKYCDENGIYFTRDPHSSNEQNLNP